MEEVCDMRADAAEVVGVAVNLTEVLGV